MILLVAFYLDRKKKSKAMTIYCSKDLGFVSAKKYAGNPGIIQHYFRYQEVMNKLYYRMCPVAAEQLILFQIMGVRSYQSTEDKWDLLFLFPCIFSHSHCYFKISDKYLSIDFFCKVQKPSLLSEHTCIQIFSIA